MGEIAPIYLIAPFNLISFPPPPSSTSALSPVALSLAILIVTQQHFTYKEKGQIQSNKSQNIHNRVPTVMENPGKSWKKSGHGKLWKSHGK